MWVFKLVLLLAMLASWIQEVRAGNLNYQSHIAASQDPKPDDGGDEEENEELAA